jgi:hypothetical protein
MVLSLSIWIKQVHPAVCSQYYHLSAESRRTSLIDVVLAFLINVSSLPAMYFAAILTGLGHSPGDIDLILYFNKGV